MLVRHKQTERRSTESMPALTALFVHGMGRSPISGLPMLRKLKQGGLKTTTFTYAVTLQDFASIQRRLVLRISALAATGDTILIGHSLGGVLLRAAINALPADTRAPLHLFMLGSPVQPARLAQALGSNLLYRAFTRDCGQLLGSQARMAAVGRVNVPTTSIVGDRGLGITDGPFKNEVNDGVVALSEASAPWISHQVRLHTVHTLLPSSTEVAEIILQRMQPAEKRP